MQSLQARLKAANALLAPYAVPHGGTLRRLFEEPEDDTRFPFQRDRDRIVHTQAFRRLLGKTQVFVTGEGDHYRTRLTHTVEVAQISRDMARALGLNEDLAECLALAHDLGHPPFGHAGEQALDKWMQTHGQRFEHNQQSLRVITVLEEHASQYQGLNVNVEILEGIQKHRDPSAEHERGLSLEAQIVDIADQIAYMGHDTDDGLRAGIFSREDLQSLSLPRTALERTQKRGTSLRGGIIHLLTANIYEHTERILAQKNILTLADVYAQQERVVEFSENMRAQLKELRSFLLTRLYDAPIVRERTAEGEKIVEELCKTLFEKPTDKVLALQKRTASSLVEAVKDYVAGMTDSFAKMQVKQK